MKKITLMLMTALLGAGFIAGNLSQNASADDVFSHPIDKTEQKCMASADSTLAMNRCTEIARQAWEKDIKKSLAELQKLLPADEYSEITRSQACWEQFKNAENSAIEAITADKQGSMYSNVKKGLRANIFKQRALKLQEYISIYND